MCSWMIQKQQQCRQQCRHRGVFERAMCGEGTVVFALQLLMWSIWLHQHRAEAGWCMCS